jgi:putative ABC transport system substrate-binding protein
MRILAFAALIISLAPLAAEARDPNGGYRIGVLTELSQKTVENWRTVLAKRGYIEGEKVLFVFRAAEGNFDLLPKLARELVDQQVDIILTLSTPPAVAAKQATGTIPIVTMSADPIGARLVESLANPRGNVNRAVPSVTRLGLQKAAVAEGSRS